MRRWVGPVRSGRHSPAHALFRRQVGATGGLDLGRHVRAGCTVEAAGDPLASLAVDGLGFLLVTRGLGSVELGRERLTSLIQAHRLHASGSSQGNQGRGQGQ